MVDCLRDMDLTLTVVDVIKDAVGTVLHAIYRLVSAVDSLRSLHSEWRGRPAFKPNIILRWLLDFD